MRLWLEIPSIRLPTRRRQLANECRDEAGNVVHALAQRWNGDRKHVQAIEQILTERIVRHRLFEVSIRRGNDADVDLDRPVAAQALDRSLLENPQQLDLHVERHFADLVQEDRRPVGGFEAAHLASDCTGEGPALVAEELAFDERRWNRRAVDEDHGKAAPGAGIVNRLSEELLAHTGLAEEQHRRTGRCHVVQLIENTTNRLAPVDDRSVGLNPGHPGGCSGVVIDRLSGADRMEVAIVVHFPCGAVHYPLLGWLACGEGYAGSAP